jgi:hypothetical protein
MWASCTVQDNSSMAAALGLSEEKTQNEWSFQTWQVISKTKFSDLWMLKLGM